MSRLPTRRSSGPPRAGNRIGADSVERRSEVTYIESVSEAAAAGPVAAMYETDEAVFGFLPNFTRGFSLRPEVYAAWRQLNGAIKTGMDLRRYELATIAAARRLR